MSGDAGMLGEPILRLRVADPGLRTLSGHNAGALQALARAAENQQVEFFCHRAPDPGLQAAAVRLGVRLTPCFSDCFYDAFKSAQKIADVNDLINSLARDYGRLFEELAKTDPGAVVLHHTMDWPNLIALGVANARQTVDAQSVRHLVFLLFDPGADASGRVVDQRRFLNHRMALARLAAQGNVRLFTSCRDYQAAFAAMVPPAYMLSLHPAFYFHAAEGASKRGQACSGRLSQPVRGARLALYLGDAKVEKGFCALPELIRMLAPHLDDRSELVIHYNLNDALASAKVSAGAKAIAKLAENDPRIKVSSSFLDDDALMEIISGSALVFFNYDPQTYANKPSGLLLQACYSRTPVVLIGDSWLAREAERLNPRVRKFDSLRALEVELAAKERFDFEPHAIDADYRSAVLSPIDTFLARQRNFPILVPHAVKRSPRRALFVDAEVPNPSTSAGGYAAVREMDLLLALGYKVSFATAAGFSLVESAARLMRQGVDLLYRPRYHDVTQVLTERGREFDIVYVTRFQVARLIMDAVRSFAPQAKLVLNVADLHFLRELRKAKIAGDNEAISVADAIREQEMSVLSQVDLVLTYTDVEQAVVESHLGGRVPVARCPWVEDVVAEAAPYDARRDIAFLGGYAHSPNVDAVLWFVERVMPRLREKVPGVCFRVYGATMPQEVKHCAGEDVIIGGFVADVADVYDSCRVFVAPLRYGAGLKGKVAAALARGVPCVLSPVAAEGLFSGSSAAAAVAQTPDEWVAAIAAVYSDRALWRAASLAALDYGARHFRFEDAVRHMSKALDLLDAVRKK